VETETRSGAAAEADAFGAIRRSTPAGDAKDGLTRIFGNDAIFAIAHVALAINCTTSAIWTTKMEREEAEDGCVWRQAAVKTLKGLDEEHTLSAEEKKAAKVLTYIANKDNHLQVSALVEIQLG